MSLITSELPDSTPILKATSPESDIAFISFGVIATPINPLLAVQTKSLNFSFIFSNNSKLNDSLNSKSSSSQSICLIPFGV